MTYKGNIINATAPNRIEINGKRVRILDSKTHTYKLNKTSISAQGGADGYAGDYDEYKALWESLESEAKNG